MSADPRVFLETDYGFATDYARLGSSAELAEQTKASIFSLTTIFACFWSFYEAMRQGKPLTDGDEKLAQLKGAMRSMTKRS